ncbi:LacI family DNA-binding transcriptional regulator [Nakamurella deserti]|uniref:LacI family DNA-binding transcriptional regulator n=1 Tax=Nakamurella deserti TaxID=2164074 RepID=UPI000DBE29B0|nr:LacI family DNA-binding transcriptional regulator [Nakamurella deserti]
MTRQRVTLGEVARHAGVSRTTASFVMTGRRDMRISADAEQRVLQAARELDYRPNLLAKSLRTNLSQTIGLISDVIATESFAGQLIRSSMTTALLHDHLLFVGESEGDPHLEQQLVRSMLDRGVGGFLYASLDTRQVQLPEILKSEPVVMLNCLDPGADVPAVIPDEETAGRVVAQALLDAGHTDGIHLIGETLHHVIAGAERYRGVVSKLEESGLQLAGQVSAMWWPEQSHSAVSRLLQQSPAPTALICMNDRVAFGAYQALSDAGLSVPEDVSVISFDDSDLAAWSRPGLTSIAIPHLELGRRATELLLRPAEQRAVHRVPMRLTRRGSVAAPR